MPDKNIYKIINDTEKYLKNIDKYHSNKLYINGDNLKNSISNTKEFIVADNQGKKSKEMITDKDLFGNVLATKEEWESSSSLDEMNSMICECQKCPLGKTRTNFVFGVGNSKADIVVVGEAPGADEDAQGEPFVGRAGQLLNKILASINLNREEVYICNILKCRPPGNRNPMPEEIEKCEPYLKYQLHLIKPKLILCLGKFAAETLLHLNLPLNKMRGNVYYYNGVKTLVTFHPAALLRNPHWKAPTWEDMKNFLKLYDDIRYGGKGK